MTTILISLPTSNKELQTFKSLLIPPGLNFLVDCHRFECLLEIETDPLHEDRARLHLKALHDELKSFESEDDQILEEIYLQLKAREGEPDYLGIGIPAIPYAMAYRRAFNLDRLCLTILKLDSTRIDEHQFREDLSRLRRAIDHFNIGCAFETHADDGCSLSSISVRFPRMQVGQFENVRLLGMNEQDELPQLRRIKIGGRGGPVE